MERRRRLPKRHLLNVFDHVPQREVGPGLWAMGRERGHGRLSRHGGRRVADGGGVDDKGVGALLRRHRSGVLLRDELLVGEEGELFPGRLGLVGVGVGVERNDVLLLLDEVVVQVGDGGPAGGEGGIIREGRGGGRHRLAVRVLGVVDDGILEGGRRDELADVSRGGRRRGRCVSSQSGAGLDHVPKLGDGDPLLRVGVEDASQDLVEVVGDGEDGLEKVRGASIGAVGRVLD